MTNPNDIKYLNALHKISGVGAQRLRKLISFFGNAENAWNAKLEHLISAGVGEKIAGQIFEARRHIDPEEEMRRLEKENIYVLEFNDSRYPTLLKESSQAPYLIYVKSALASDADTFSELFDSPMISIIGARKNTPYGAMVAQKLTQNLVEAGITIVSGMAFGIDSWVHRSVLDNGGRTLAVLGNSLDEKNIYPKNNLALAREIIQSGALLSEYPPETPAGPMTFPARNRIVAGLSLGTIVVEAGEKSGALITAQMALDNNREVFAVPGPIFGEASVGTNNLLRSGAKIVTGIKDVLEELGLEKQSRKKNSPPKNPENEMEKILLGILSSEPLHIDNIARIAKLQTASVAGTLSIMELKGWTKNIGGQNYILM